MLFTVLFTFALILFVILIHLLNDLKRFTKKDEVYFFGLFIKKQAKRKTQWKIKFTALSEFANSSRRNRILCWLELSIFGIGYFGGILLFVISFIFLLGPIWWMFCLLTFTLPGPILLILTKQLYDFWKSQPIWQERPINEQPFLLPNVKDHKRLRNLWLQIMILLYLLLFLGIYYNFSVI